MKGAAGKPRRPETASVVIVVLRVLRRTLAVEGLDRVERVLASHDCVVPGLLVPIVGWKRELSCGWALAQFDG